MLILLCLLLFYGLRFVLRALWRLPLAFFNVVLAWAFMGMGALYGLGMIYDPARAYRHGAMVVICYAWAVAHCLIASRCPVEPHLPKAQVIS